MTLIEALRSLPEGMNMRHSEGGTMSAFVWANTLEQFNKLMGLTDDFLLSDYFVVNGPKTKIQSWRGEIVFTEEPNETN